MIQGSDGVLSDGELLYGMVGGGPGSFVGDVHRKAAAFDRKARLVSGAFSRNYEGTVSTGLGLGLEPQRLYRSFDEMAEREAARQDRIDFVSIVTPNYAHYDVAKTFLMNSINVVCDKPLAFKVEEAQDLARLAEEKGLLFCVTYTNSGHVMVKHAREMVRRGEIGEIRMVMGEYPQDWLATEIECQGQKQASWRTDPAQSGVSNCVGDIGSHIENTVAYITGLRIKSLCANLDVFGAGRKLDDNAGILLKYTSGASGMYWSSQVAIGHDNGLKVRIFGSKGSIEWEQENLNYLRVAFLGQPVQILSRGCGYIHLEAARVSRIPSGHPEGYYEAFTNIYTAFAGALLKKKAGLPLTEADLDFPNAEAGVSGVKFINACVESAKKGSVWVTLG